MTVSGISVAMRASFWGHYQRICTVTTKSILTIGSQIADGIALELDGSSGRRRQASWPWRFRGYRNLT